mmetsp:Transcript_117170/g.304011  ORF Transcript_117170/g.304011 Transcript_117170/m.304011 type:complete len:897 (+) Transcript_117170:212-2902(+)
MGAVPSSQGKGGEGGPRRALCCDALPEEKVALLDPPADSQPVLVDGNHNGDGHDGIAMTSGGASSSTHSVIQFSTSHYYCTETEGFVVLDIVRLGASEHESVCDYYTLDGSAKAGRKFIAQEGTVVFKPGDTVQAVKIEVIQDDNWDATLEFAAVVHNVRGAFRGKYLHTCQVKIIDDDAFPTNKHRDSVKDPELIQGIFGPSLMVEYLKMSMDNELIFYGVVYTICMDVIKALYFFLTLYLQLYLVDVVLAPPGGEEVGMEERRLSTERRYLLRTLHASGGLIARALGEELGEEESEGGEEGMLLFGSKHYTAMAVGVFYIMPFCLNHMIDYSKARLGVASAARKTLQANLLRKFLNYRAEVRDCISAGDLTMAMTRDVMEVVDVGFMKLLKVVSIISKLCFSLVFVLAENKMAAIPLGVFPIIMGAFLLLRERKMVEAAEIMAAKQNNLVHKVHDTVNNFKLVSDFLLKPYMVETYEECIDQYNSKAESANQVMTNNAYLAPWLTTVLIGGFIILCTGEVTTINPEGTMSLGAFLATVNVFKEIGTELREIYMESMEVQKTFGALRKLCFFLNQPTDLGARMAINRQRRKLGTQRREAARARTMTQRSLAQMLNAELVGTGQEVKTKEEETVFAVDTVTIEFKNVTFWYPGHNAPLLKRVTVEFKQGKLYALTGKRHQGKATILKLLGEVLLPDVECGEVFVPPHMRILHVSKEVGVLKAGLIPNLIFNNDLETLGGMKRISKICELCGFSPNLLEQLSMEPPPGTQAPAHDEEKEHETWSQANWATGLSQTDYARLNLARVLITNPECLVMHMPFISFSDEDAQAMTVLVRQHVQERGILMPAAERSIRRPRTAFFSSSALERCSMADKVYEVSIDYGIKLVRGQEEVPASDK